MLRVASEMGSRTVAIFSNEDRFAKASAFSMDQGHTGVLGRASIKRQKHKFDTWIGHFAYAEPICRTTR
jgi:hypothetical protein